MEMAGFDRDKTPKRSLTGLSKAHLRWYIPLAPNGIRQGLPSQEALRTGSAPQALANTFRLFEKARKGLSRGGAAR
jgi:hypothetical protein